MKIFERRRWTGEFYSFRGLKLIPCISMYDDDDLPIGLIHWVQLKFLCWAVGVGFIGDYPKKSVDSQKPPG